MRKTKLILRTTGMMFYICDQLTIYPFYGQYSYNIPNTLLSRYSSVSCKVRWWRRCFHKKDGNKYNVV